jgi:hypothetical protein
MPKDVQAEFRSKQGASISSSAAIMAASAGVRVSGAEPPEMTSPMSALDRPARSMAMRAAAPPLWMLSDALTSKAARRSRFFVSRI